jgi:hypothetical protein
VSREALADLQAALVAALVTGATIPPGFDPTRVRAARNALLRKRAGEVAATWPALRIRFGPQWMDAFGSFAATRPTQGALRDGWDFARFTSARGEPHRDAAVEDAAVEDAAVEDAAVEDAAVEDAAVELAIREATWRYDGSTPPRRRRVPAVRRAGTAIVVQLAGRVRCWRREPP